jgi:transcriptional regulator with XRE-family HTH domain
VERQTPEPNALHPSLQVPTIPLAERAQVSADAISALERGRRRRPRLETVALLADALGLDGADRATWCCPWTRWVIRAWSERDLGWRLWACLAAILALDAAEQGGNAQP